MNKLQRFFSKKATEKELKFLKDELDTANKQIAELSKNINTLLENAEKLEIAKRNKFDSPEPWIEMKNIVSKDKGGINIELDWNDAFIKHLRENGFDGENDDIIIQKYISVLSQQIRSDLEDMEITEEEI